MSKPHYIVRRSRNGRFNFTLITGQGRITGYVEISTSDKTTAEMFEEVHQKIRTVADELLKAAGIGAKADMAAGCDDRDPSGSVRSTARSPMAEVTSRNLNARLSTN